MLQLWKEKANGLVSFKPWTWEKNSVQTNLILLPGISLCGIQKLHNVSGFFALQSRYVGYYEILKNKYNFKLPPERQLKIKNLKIHSIHGKNFWIWAFLSGDGFLAQAADLCSVSY